MNLDKIGINQMAEITAEVLKQLKANGMLKTEEAPETKTIVPDHMTLDLAEELIAQVRAEAGRVGVNAVIAVSDAEGRPVAIQCMDHSYIGSFDVALNKTYTAIAFQMSTAVLGKLAAPGGDLYGIQHTNQGKIVIFGGGDPLYVNGTMIGAIGVSGGTAEQDTALSAYGKHVFEAQF